MPKPAKSRSAALRPDPAAESLAAANPLANRKGARRMSEIPPNVLAALNAGELATVNLVESLAIDMSVLARRAFRRLGHDALAEEVGLAADALAESGVMRRLIGIGAAIHEILAAKPRRLRIKVLSQIAGHPSDTVRSWACFAAQAGESTSLDDRLGAVRPFAADPHFGVRECAWMSVRPFYAEQLDGVIDGLLAWTADGDANIRRFAIESTRPRGVWCAHLAELKSDPQRAAHLLEPVRSDPSRYVQSSVANWLNDAAKSNARWVTALCRRWRNESPMVETAWIVKRALRSIRE